MNDITLRLIRAEPTTLELHYPGRTQGKNTVYTGLTVLVLLLLLLLPRVPTEGSRSATSACLR